MKHKKYIFSSSTKENCTIWACFMIFLGLVFAVLPLLLKDFSLFWFFLIEPVLAIFLPLILFERFAVVDEEKISLYKYNKKQQTVLWENVSTIVVKKPKILNPKDSNKLKNLGFLLIADIEGNFIRLSHNQRTENLIRLYFKGEIIRQAVWFQDINSIFPQKED